MMARSKCSNQRPDTLMQDRSPPARRNHLQRTAGPYIRVNLVILTVGRPLPVYPYKQTFSEDALSSGAAFEIQIIAISSLPWIGESRPIPFRNAGAPFSAA